MRWLGVSLFILSMLGLIAGYLIFTPPEPYTPLSGLDPSQVSLIAVGDQGSGDLQQWTVAQAMERVAAKAGRLDFVVFLGDNFYGKSLTGTSDKNWQMKFERVYWGHWLSHVPFYAVLGNHDYPVSQEIEIQYSQQHKGSGRWQMPGHVYTKDFGDVDGRPLVRVVFLDTSAAREGLQQQIDFLEQAFQQPGPAPIWRVVAAHHPVRNMGQHGEDAQLVSALLPALQRSNVDLFLAGHDHNQQLQLRAGEPAWVISGAGGQKLYALDKGSTDTTFAASKAGFAKLDFNATQLKLAYYDDRGNTETDYRWARDCQWMAKGCLVAEKGESTAAQ
jgi:tartrate-resistant acid phosphatase type 5